MAEVIFKDGVLSGTSQNINDLIAGNSVHLKVEAQEQLYDSEEDDDFTEMDQEKFVAACEKWRQADFVDKTFDEVRSDMTEIGLGIYKKVILEGFGDPIPEENAKVTMVYSVFLEKSVIPIDSTLVTGKTFSFITGSNVSLLVGVYHSVMSMRMQEQAQFIIPYKYLYGELGCPTRIPPQADGLVLIRVLKVEPGCGNREVVEFEVKNFSSVKEKVEELRQKGRRAVAGCRYGAAVHSYHEAVRILERVDASGQEEDQERNHLVVKMLINAGITYNKQSQPKRACTSFNEAQRYFPDVPREMKGKLFMHKGRALRNLGDFQHARQCLHEAQKFSSAPEIAKELTLLNQEQSKYDKAMAEMMQKALNLKDKVNKSKVSKMNLNFETTFTETVRKFVSDENVTKLMFSENVTEEQRKIMDNVLAKEDNVTLNVLPSENTTRYCLVKKN